MGKINIFWFRRDLRLFDNAGLYHALKSNLPVLPVFIFDTKILSKLNSEDNRIPFIYRTLVKLKNELEKYGSTLKILHGEPLQIFKKLVEEYKIDMVFTNHDYEPYARERDLEIHNFLKSENINFQTYKDHVIFEKSEVVKDDGNPYVVFTPYSKKWKQLYFSQIPENYPSEKLIYNLFRCKPMKIPSLKDIGFIDSLLNIPSSEIDKTVINNYSKSRDYPSVNGTSRLGIHLRFGTVSIRELTKTAVNQSEVFLNELIWRNFFIDILWHFPFVENSPFKKQYLNIEWRNDEKEFGSWCRGETGYPLIDAGMRELNQTGFMHNRVRMAVASFLVKHLLIDWRWGEAYFAEKLLDFELASNNGNWQWAAGTGCDAAPYFRIFNPESQQKKFDSGMEYIRKWVPEVDGFNYPNPIIDHKFARERALTAYKKVLNKSL
ncbi:MAG: deoxyribodipyrimidine photo-lyase [Prolixibacteraceae bacterium]|nr:deoxyribodipyrimidine photo-lyase [Prolixibacteraceae bacterium]MBN2772931.1 deoxyribodipyrimidine photo-lyase [Prolixibacteraceae bacterium]